MNRKNLKKLADYLADLPEGGPIFDMIWYYSIPYDHNVYPSEIVTDSCQTTACAVGHATHIPGLEAYEDEHTWGNYISRIFGFEESCTRYDWCFNSDWANYDNTPEGASKRIKYLLKHGVPDGFDSYGDIGSSYVALYQ